MFFLTINLKAISSIVGIIAKDVCDALGCKKNH